MHPNDLEDILDYTRQAMTAPAGAQAAPELPQNAISPEQKRFIGEFLKDVLQLFISKVASGGVPFR